MIKKAVLLTVSAPFLMVFSSFAHSSPTFSTPAAGSGSFGSPAAACSAAIANHNSGLSGHWLQYRGINALERNRYNCMHRTCYANPYDPSQPCDPSVSSNFRVSSSNCSGSDYCSALAHNPELLPQKTDEECESENGDSISVSASSANYLNSGGSVKTHGGACSITGAGGVVACSGTDDNISCSVPIDSTSAGEYGQFNQDSSLNGGWGEGEGTFSVIDFNVPEYLNALPGGCSDPSSCVTIGDTSYLVDWDSAPDYFSYVDSNGTVHSKPSSGGGGGDNGGGDNGGGDPTNPTDPTDPGGDNGGGDGDTGGGDPGNDNGDNPGGGGSGGGSTVPDFEFDESGIIEAIGSAGRSNRNAIDALSTDVTGAISSQTDDLTASNNTQTQTLSNAIADQSTAFTAALDGQTENVTGAIDTQTGALTGSLDALSTSIFDAIASLGFGEGDGEGEEGDGLLGGISNLLNGMVDNLASRFTEDLGTGDDLFNSSGLDDTLDGVAAQEQEHSDEINTLMDEIGDGATSDIADQITSRLPSLPSGSCVPLQFGPMEISCQAFNTIKLWLTWIIYFWTVVSIVDTFFRSEQRTA
ncbi:hypothetical protein ACQKE4_09755 [Halomonas sp. NPDC076908]|uniref:hypothetical protein n=1 Tax=Halomonas sp. NPDC076908 TaxID=3390567 RepID=UPI003D08C7C2